MLERDITQAVLFKLATGLREYRSPARDTLHSPGCLVSRFVILETPDSACTPHTSRQGVCHAATARTRFYDRRTRSDTEFHGDIRDIRDVEDLCPVRQ
jgi:hypothetical protein